MVSNCELSLFILIETWSEREGNNDNHFRKKGWWEAMNLMGKEKRYQWWAKSPGFNPLILPTDYHVSTTGRGILMPTTLWTRHTLQAGTQSQKTLCCEQDQWACRVSEPDPHTLWAHLLEAHSLPDSTTAAPGSREALGSPCCLPSSCAWAAALFLNSWETFSSVWGLGRVILWNLGPPWLPHLPRGSGSWVSRPLQGQM